MYIPKGKSHESGEMIAQLRWKQYEHLPHPKPEALIGKWRVRMDTRWGWLFRNVKVIEVEFHRGRPIYNPVGAFLYYEVDSVVVGHNIAFGIKEWGKFDVNKDGELHYRDGKIVDKLVQITPGMMKGLYIKDDEPKAMFTLEKL